MMHVSVHVGIHESSCTDGDQGVGKSHRTHCPAAIEGIGTHVGYNITGVLIFNAFGNHQISLRHIISIIIVVLSIVARVCDRHGSSVGIDVVIECLASGTDGFKIVGEKMRSCQEEDK